MRVMERSALFLAMVFALIGVGCAQDAQPTNGALSAVEAMSGDTTGYARADHVRPFTFPEDHGPHPGFQTEWWYWTGNLEAEDGRRFGFQLTIFRSAMTPDTTVDDRESDWGTNQLYMGHVGITDVAAGRHYAEERLRRGAVGLAGAQAEPFRTWLDDWSAELMPDVDASGFGMLPVRLRASAQGAALDLRLIPQKSAVLQGDRGLSQKGPEPGNASYYFSLTRISAEGTIMINGDAIRVRGLAWMDREWSTSALGAGQVGWDWFSLQLSDGRDLMVYQLRRTDGSIDPISKGSLVEADGSYRRIDSTEFTLTPLGHWTSPLGARYTVQWQVEIPGEGIALRVAAPVREQEMALSVRYWEGTVDIEGTSLGRPVTGSGYLEMTGYE
ncbi:lipocalin-like domain-containing protein [soil metagenome]